LFYSSPLLAGILTFCLLTLSGIPLAAGFFAKFYVFKIVFEAHYYVLVVVSLLTALLAAYYYLRIIGVMLTKGEEVADKPEYSWSAYAVGIAACLVVIALPCYPAPLLKLLT